MDGNATPLMLKNRSTNLKVKRYIAEQRGGWKVLVLIAGAAGAVGSFLGWVFSNFHVHAKGMS